MMDRPILDDATGPERHESDLHAPDQNNHDRQDGAHRAPPAAGVFGWKGDRGETAAQRSASRCPTQDYAEHLIAGTQLQPCPAPKRPAG